jgi:hypothetical protein
LFAVKVRERERERGQKGNFGCRGRINGIKPKGSSSKVGVFLKSLYFQPISSYPIGRQTRVQEDALYVQGGFLQELSFLQNLAKVYDALLCNCKRGETDEKCTRGR